LLAFTVKVLVHHLTRNPSGVLNSLWRKRKIRKLKAPIGVNGTSTLSKKKTKNRDY